MHNTYNQNYEKSIADCEEHNELIDYETNLYDGVIDKKLFETEKTSVVIVKPDDGDDYYTFCEWLEDSSYIAQETTDGHFIFYEDSALIENLEHDLYKSIETLNIRATIK